MSFEGLNTVYNKKNKENLNNINVFGLISMLSMNSKNWKALKEVDKYLYYLDKEKIAKLLYCLVPRQIGNTYYGYIKKGKKESLLEKIHTAIRKHLKYSEREYSYVKKFINKKINGNEKEWKQKLGIGGKNGSK